MCFCAISCCYFSITLRRNCWALLWDSSYWCCRLRILLIRVSYYWIRLSWALFKKLTDSLGTHLSCVSYFNFFIFCARLWDFSCTNLLGITSSSKRILSWLRTLDSMESLRRGVGVCCVLWMLAMRSSILEVIMILFFIYIK